MGAARTRINARIEPRLARRLETVRRRTGKSLTQILTESLERYCDAAVEDAGSPSDALSKLIGCGEGPPNLSTTYKDDLVRSLGRKA